MSPSSIPKASLITLKKDLNFFLSWLLYLCNWGKAVGSAGGVGDNVHLWLEVLLVDAHDEHGGIGGWGRDDDALGATLQMSRGLLGGGEDTGGLDDDLGTRGGPLDVGGVSLTGDGDLLAVDDQFAVALLDCSLENAVSRVVFEHVDHVLQGDEGVVDGDNIDIVAVGTDAGDQTEATIRAHVKMLHKKTRP